MTRARVRARIKFSVRSEGRVKKLRLWLGLVLGFGLVRGLGLDRA